MKKKKTNPRKKVITEYDIKRIQKEMEAYVESLSIVVALMVAHDEFGFGPSRLERLASKMARKYQDMEEGHFKIEEAEAWANEYMKCRIEHVEEV